MKHLVSLLIIVLAGCGDKKPVFKIIEAKTSEPSKAIKIPEPGEQGNMPTDISHVEIGEDASWVEIFEVLGELLAEGITKVQINDLFYEYRCAHCIGIDDQGKDPISIDPSNLNPFFEWCDKNRGKYPNLFIGDKVKYPEVEQIFSILNERGFTFYLERSSGDNREIKVDLYDGRFEQEKTKEPNHH